MKKFLLLLLLVTSYTGWGQCDVYITPGSIQVIDHNPGISFAFEIQNDDIIPYSGGPLYMDWALIWIYIRSYMGFQSKSYTYPPRSK
jgi:hypothetical protein